MATPALEITAVTKRYGTHVAVDDVSFVVPSGLVYGMLGPNGAGKSTTLRMVNDILAPDAGTIRLFGAVPPGKLAAPRIGYLPEERGLYPKMRVLDMVAFMGELRGLSGKEARRRGASWLERLGLGDWLKHRVQDLSKGMQQKVQFATTVLHDPELVILDEPWSGLDPINADVLREVVVGLRAAGKTVLFSTHQMEQAEKICDHVCIIARGRKVLDGDLADIKRAASNDHRVALAFADRHAADPILADRALVAALRPPRPGDTADCEVDLAPGVGPDALLRALVEARVSVRKFELVTPTLHQIFVDRVGAEQAAVAARRPEPWPGAPA
ncbi:MAG: ATP-binding cassette domain-containing protein [Myxococcota bacterium]